MSRTAVRVMIATIALCAAAASPALAQTDPTPRYTVDQSSSQVGFTVTARVLFNLKRDGQFHDFVGEVVYDPAHPLSTRVDLTVYTASVDLHNGDQEDLLRSDEFFDVDRHPTMHFVSTGAGMRPDGKLEVMGDLTIRGVTKRLVVPIEITPQHGNGTAFQTSFQIDRTEFGLNGGGPRSRQ